MHSYGMPIRGPTTLYDEEGIITTVAADIVSQTEFDQRTADGADTAQTQGVDEPGAAAVANANADGRVDPAIVTAYYESNGRRKQNNERYALFHTRPCLFAIHTPYGNAYTLRMRPVTLCRPSQLSVHFL